MSTSPTAGSPASGGSSVTEVRHPIDGIPRQLRYALDDEEDDDERHQPTAKRRCHHHRSRNDKGNDDSDDCNSDASEVLSVGNDEPGPSLSLVNLEHSKPENSRIHQPISASRDSSPESSINNADSCLGASSPDQRANGVATFGYPVTYPGQGRVPDYPVTELGSYSTSRLLQKNSIVPIPSTNAVVFPGIQERIQQRVPVSVPLLGRLSLSPPSVMTVTGLPVVPPVIHPAVCRGDNARDSAHHQHHTLPHQQHHHHAAAAAAAAAAALQQLQHALGSSNLHPVLPHVPTATAMVRHQQRLAVNKILQQKSSPDSVLLNRAEELQQQISINGRCFPLGTNGLAAAAAAAAAAASSNNNHNTNSNDHDGNCTSSNNIDNNININSGNDNNSSNSSSNNNHNNHINNNNNNTQHQTSLKFSIDNILKADFGRRITDPISLKKLRPKKSLQSSCIRPIDLSRDFLETSSEGSERGSETSSTRNVSPSLPVSSPASNSTPTSTTESKAMQWPAWVYCTRYSDRPSSGKSIINIFLVYFNSFLFFYTIMH